MFWGEYLKKRLSLLLIIFMGLGGFWFTFLMWQLPLTPLRNAGALLVLTLVVYIIFDYLAFKKAQQILRDLQADMQQLTAEITHRTQQEKEFLDIMRIWSHQMKVPLASIDLVAQTRLPELKKQTFALENYLNILLEYLRINNVATDFRFERVDGRTLLNRLVKKYAIQFIQKNIAVEIIGDVTLKTDARWLGVALEQVINNAVKYTDRGRVTITLSDQGIKISDTGIGILAEDIPRLFAHGFTGYNGRLDKKASGLGLYLAKLILDKLDFQIEVTSQVGVGSTLKINKR
ncbi:HAMP domain-containing histidine kinase [Leuconostoc carnosum]|uniref:sensor histidine kinase n=1 Tax=Leuconostoc TaxID=1243 RepID=UPI000D50B8A7|nr:MULTISPECIES: sensor histidine kinase [Leuconostoc]KAA8324512.1 HAMP domain-containing histidine kinase [Leuconostoc carnosum]KAA8358185.1 HAMP domain-containing histidine kinase [Leuconostoc carnosum]KAA8364683.1 HAMP domain-containing histidine kinase [Leuconostoc carnosum]KAA8365556.1 HAMP domain-containing histidine kinase [Leuconostoc carnosum]KAA8371584.1 HAMP domain-containing histidine kinase [Leuconostoc carnosum]